MIIPTLEIIRTVVLINAWRIINKTSFLPYAFSMVLGLPQAFYGSKCHELCDLKPYELHAYS